MPNIFKVQDFGTGANSFINLGAVAALLSNNIRSELALIYPKGAGGGNNGYIASRVPSASTGGHRLFLFDSSGLSLVVGKTSSTAGNPQASTPHGAVPLNQWSYVAATHNASVNGLTGAAMKLFYCLQGSSITETATYRTRTNGSGSLSSNSADNFYLGNRQGGDRALNAKKAFYAAWAVELTPAELEAARVNGPLTVRPESLLICWANGQDYGPYGITPVSVGAGVTDDTETLPTNLSLGELSGGTVSGSVSATEQQDVALCNGVLARSGNLTASEPADQFNASGSVSQPGAVSGAMTASEGIDVFFCAGSRTTNGTVDASENPDVFNATGSVAGSGVITIRADHDRASIVLSGSSVAGSGDAAVISLKPKVQESEVVSSETRWLKPHARIDGVLGLRPTFRFLDYKSGVGGSHYYPWGAQKRPMFSYTGEEDDWHYFDTTTLVANSHIEFRHDTPFSQDSIYVCYSRAVRPKRFMQWLEAWQSAHPTKVHPAAPALSYTPTSAVADWPGQQFIADEFSTQVDSIGQTVPVTPLPAVEFRDDSLPSPLSSKAVVMMQVQTHAGEDQTLYLVRAFINFLLGDSPTAIELRRYFAFVLVGGNMPGWTGGGWRGSFTQGVGGKDDANRTATSTDSGLEIVDKPKAAMLAAAAGRQVSFFIDWHGSFSDDYWIYTLPTIDDEQFIAAVNSFGGPTFTGNASESTVFWSYWAKLAFGINDCITIEHGDPTEQDNTVVQLAGEAVAKTVDLLRAQGNLTMPAAASGTTGVLQAAEAGDAFSATGSVVSNNVISGVVQASELADTLQFVGSRSSVAHAVLTEQSDTFAAVGQHGVTGAVTAQEAADSFSGTGQVGAYAPRGRAKVWDGTQFVFVTPRKWDGTQWRPVKAKRWNGTSWQTMP